MLYVDFSFILFFIVVFISYWLLPKNNQRNFFLLLSSYVFYSFWDYRFLSLIIFSSLTDYYLAKIISKEKNTKSRKILLLTSLALNLSLLFGFKYLASLIGFFDQYFPTVLADDVTSLSIVLPLGISFYTFQSISYVVDVYNGRLEASNSIFDFLLYISFFPQLIAGPIVRSDEFLPQLRSSKYFKAIDFRKYILLIVIGFFKKLVLADRFSYEISYFNDHNELYNSLGIFQISFLNYIRLYLDFSAYSDISVGLAGLLGFKIPQNFINTLLAKNIVQRWASWHITFYDFIRDYIFSPIARFFYFKTKKTKLSIFVAIFISFAFSGFWHAIGSNILYWFAIHLIAFVFSILFSKYSNFKLPSLLSVIITLIWFSLTSLVTINLTDSNFTNLYLRIFNWSELGREVPPILFVLAILTVVFQYIDFKFNLIKKISKLNPIIFTFLLSTLTISLIRFSVYGIKEFVYFQF